MTGLLKPDRLANRTNPHEFISTRTKCSVALLEPVQTEGDVPTGLVRVQRAKPFGMSETIDLLVVCEAREGIGHAGKAELGKQVECGGVSAFSRARLNRALSFLSANANYNCESRLPSAS